MQFLRHNMNNNKKNGGFYAENSRNDCADISTFGNNFGPKPAITVVLYKIKFVIDAHAISLPTLIQVLFNVN